MPNSAAATNNAVAIQIISENDWIQVIGFFTRPQLLRLGFIHRIFHYLIEQYFPARPFAPTELVISTDKYGQLYAAIAIIEWKSPQMVASLEKQKAAVTSIGKMTKWIGINGYDDYELNENARAMEKCVGIVETYQDERHSNCPDWHLHPIQGFDSNEKGAGHNFANVESAFFEHYAHLEGDEEIFPEINGKCTYDGMPPELIFPLRLNAHIFLDGPKHQHPEEQPFGNFYDRIYQWLLAHLDLPFIRVKKVSILEERAPWWLEIDGDEEFNEKMCNYKEYIDENNKINVANQLFTALADIFTSQNYKNVNMTSIFSETRLSIKMPMFTELFMVHLRQTQQKYDHILEPTHSLTTTTMTTNIIDNVISRKLIIEENSYLTELLCQMAHSCRKLILYFGLENIEPKISPLKELISNTPNGGLSLFFPPVKANIVPSILPILYSYNPKSNAECRLKVGRDQEIGTCEELLEHLLNDSLLTKNPQSNVMDAETSLIYATTYQLKMLYHHNDFDDVNGWKSVLKEINIFMRSWQQWQQKNEEAEEICPRTNADFVFKKDVAKQQLLQHKNCQKQFYIRLILSPTIEGCQLNIHRYMTSETTLHEKLRTQAQQMVKWWRRCFQLANAFEGAASVFYFWQKDMQNEHASVRIIEKEGEISKSWTNYIVAKWLENWMEFFD